MDSRLDFGRASKAFNTWLQASESAEAGRRLKMELLLKWKRPTQAMLGSCFRFWAWYSATQARRVRLLARAFASRTHRVLCKIFLNWGELAAEQAGQSFALAAHLQQTRAVVTARFFRAWSWTARYHSRLRSSMHRFALKSSRTWLRLAFLRWSEFVGDVMSVRAGGPGACATSSAPGSKMYVSKLLPGFSLSEPSTDGRGRALCATAFTL